MSGNRNGIGSSTRGSVASGGAAGGAPSLPTRPSASHPEQPHASSRPAWAGDSRRSAATGGSLAPRSPLLSVQAPACSRAGSAAPAAPAPSISGSASPDGWAESAPALESGSSWPSDPSLPSRGTVQPEPHTLTWPDGRKSVGSVSSGPSGLRFHAQHGDPVLGERKSSSASGVTAPIAVTSIGSGRTVIPTLPEFEPTRTRSSWLSRRSTLSKRTNIEMTLPSGRKTSESASFIRGRYSMDRQKVSVSSLINIINNASISRNGLLTNDRLIASQLIGRAVELASSQASDPAAMKNVARSLQNPLQLDYEILRSGRTHVSSTFDPQELATRVDGLPVGGSAYICINATFPPYGHALGVSVKREDASSYRTTILNSHGWGRNHDRPAMSTVASRQATIESLCRLVDDPSVYENPYSKSFELSELDKLDPTSRKAAMDWSLPFGGKILESWVNSISSTPATPTPLRQTGQKNDDCVIENAFSYLADNLEPSDYKLSKAASLSYFDQIAADLEKSDSSIDLSLERSRLRERITSSLSGRSTASAISET